jgi:Zn-dependent metalloprotease
VKGRHGPAYSPGLTFDYQRGNPWFEQVMSYYDVTGAERYIQSLGFADVNNEPQNISVDTYSGDNSFYIPGKDQIVFGKGGVDDAEDAEVIWHEYGHAIQDAEVPGFGAGHDAGSIGEGFGDYWAVTMSQPVSDGFHLPCVMDWDSTSYTRTVPHCLRRTDTNLTVNDENGEVHHDGQIWSRGLWDIHRALGREETDTIILEGQFSFAPNTSFTAAATVLVSTAKRLYGSEASGVVRKAFERRGIL